MTALPRFDFGNDFSAGTAGQDRIVLRRAEWEAEGAAREAAGYARGLQVGAAEEAASVNALLAAALDQAAAGLVETAQTLAARQQESDARAARMALALARKLACRIETDDPFGGIEQAFLALLIDLRHENEVAISLHPDLIETARARLTALCHARLAGFALRFLPDAALPPGACRIEWSCGGLIRDPAAIDAALATLVDDALPATVKEPAA